MGDRVSISFVSGNDESVALFNHWGGRGFVRLAKEYVRELKKEVVIGRADSKRSYQMSGPLSRMEPNTVMVDFIRWYANNHVEKGDRIWSSLYLGKDDNDGDNSDNGHFQIRLDTTEMQDVLDEASEDGDD